MMEERVFTSVPCSSAMVAKVWLSDIEAGHINCVIVKVLSRLGRNTIDTGYYIEQYFRIRNIRFISVHDNFDTPTQRILIPESSSRCGT